MGAGAFILTRDVIFNREVLTDGGLYYKRTVDDLASKLLWIWKNQEKKSMIIQIAQKRISTYYNWDRIANEYDKLINIICIESDQNKIKKIIKKILFDKDA
jgi:glycosyltransferase involved in cell wall biosynthesis